MQYLQFTYVDVVTGVPVTDEPPRNGPAMPDVDGIQFAWARERQYPTLTPELFGTCPYLLAKSFYIKAFCLVIGSCPRAKVAIMAL